MHLPSSFAAPLVMTLGFVGLSACSGNVGPDGADADTGMTHTLLVVEQNADLSNAEETSRSLASVWFLRVADERDLEEATHLVSDALELPAVGTCVAIGPRTLHEVPSSLDPVELAFAGDVNVHAGDRRLRLAVHAFPDVADLLSGVVYTVRDQDELGAPLGSQVRISASGSADFSPVDASAEAPEMPGGLAIEGYALPASAFEARRDRAFSLTWNPGSAKDVIYVDVHPVPSDANDRIRCALADSGAGRIPTMAIPEASEMLIAVHRVRDVPLRTDMGDVGMAHFDLSVSTRVRVAGP